MIPIKDVIPPRAAPVATMAILALGAIEFTIGWWMEWPMRQTPADFAVNAFALWLFADNVEDRLGRRRFVAVYVLCNAAGVAAAVAAARWLPVPLILSSGAVAGVLGGYFVLYPRSRVLTLFPLPIELFEVPAIFFLCAFVIVHLPGGKGPIVEVVAGLAAGASLCLAMRRPMVW